MRKWLILAYLFIGAQSFAQLVWERVELPGKQPAVFTSPRNIVFIRGDYGTNIIYRSYDEGLTWDSIITPGKKGTGYYGRSIVAVDSFGFIYSQYSDSLWVSSNDGVTWDLRKQPSAFGLFFLTSRDSVFLFSYGPWVFASSDQGASWSGIRTHSNGGDIGWAGAQISPGGNVFGFLQFDGSVWLMGGSHAQRSIQTKFSQFAIDNDPISWMMFDQEGFGYGDHNGMLIRSSDDGLTWQAIDSMNSEYRKRYWGPYGALKGGGIISVSDTETVISYDQTDTWSGIGEGVPTNYGHTFATSHRGTIFIETNSGVFRTSHFAAVKNRMPNASSIGFDPVSKILTLNEIESNSRLILTDIIGRIARQEMLRNPKEYRIDLSGIAPGTYMAAIISRSGSKSTMLSIYR